MATWSYKDIDSFYDRVRALLSTASVATITNEQMDFPEKAPMAERIIKSKVPNWEEYQTSNIEKFGIFETAIVYLTAIYFERYVIAKQPKKMQSSSLSIEYNTSTIDTSSLAGMLDDLLSELVESTTSVIGFLVV